ncbi:DUF6215 domain-containing protein [Streptomyces sp. NPDC002692]
MVGFLLRRLPFWVREPLLIIVGSVFGVRLMYLAVREHSWAGAGIGAVFLAVAAMSGYSVNRALRARRTARPEASGGGAAVDGSAEVTTAVDPAVHAAAEPPRRPEPEEKEHHAWRQAFAAVGLFGVLAAVLWWAPDMTSDNNTRQPASCSDGKREELPKAYKAEPRPVTGEELCEALNRSDLAELLGTPGETATTASGSNNTALLTDGKVAEPEAEVAFDTYTVNVSATYNKLSTEQYVKLMKYGNERDVKPVTVLGRPAVFSSDHTMKFEISLGGDGGSGGPVEEGPLARTLSVALEREDRGGYYDITVWSSTGALPDDSALLDIAEKVLPAIHGRAA